MSPRGQDTMEKIWKCILQLCSWRNFRADFFSRWMVLYWVNEKPNNYLMIGIVGTILIALCYFGRFWLVRKRIHDGWYENGKKKGSMVKKLPHQLQ